MSARVAEVGWAVRFERKDGPGQHFWAIATGYRIDWRERAVFRTKAEAQYHAARWLGPAFDVTLVRITRRAAPMPLTGDVCSMGCGFCARALDLRARRPRGEVGRRG